MLINFFVPYLFSIVYSKQSLEADRGFICLTISLHRISILSFSPNRALKLTGPFVVMIYKMISGDMFTFSIIYGIMLVGFTQAFYFLYKRSVIPDKDSKYYSYGTTWMALFHMTLGDYDVSMRCYMRINCDNCGITIP